MTRSARSPVTAHQSPSGNVIRDAEYAKRLTQACDDHAHCPENGDGRLAWLQKEMSKRGVDVSVESVRRWLSGIAKARADKNKLLAQILKVDYNWLHMGFDPGPNAGEKKAQKAVADGVVNLVAGLVQMDGGGLAFPTEDDARAAQDNIDMYAMIKGVNYPLKVTAAAQTETGALSFAVPNQHDRVMVLGVVREGFSVTIYELTEDDIEQHGDRTGAHIAVTIPKEQIKKLKRIADFAQRL